MSNKSDGNAFERDFCAILAQHGFWAHNMAQSKLGQPADVVAVRNKIGYLIDCKVVSGNAFELRRMEDNQVHAMRLWMKRGNSVPQFAIRLSDGGIYMAPYPVLHMMREHGQTRIKDQIIRDMFPRLEDWIKECE